MQDEKQMFDLSQSYLRDELRSKQPADKIQELAQILRYHEWRYYVINDPVVSDYDFDRLYKQLESLEEQFPDLIDPSSPTQRVSSDLTSDFPTVAHLSPMLSLANSYNADDLMEFDQRISKLMDRDEENVFAVEPKFDGGSLSLVYENDRLIRATTRGNGIRGDEITNNVRTLRSIPLIVPFSNWGINKVELRGEAIIPKSNFEDINKSRELQGLPLFANPRNAATGGLRMKDPNETAQRGIEVFVYQMSYAEGANGQLLHDMFSSHYETVELLGSVGFKVPSRVWRKRLTGIKEVISFCSKQEAAREDYDYEIDGMVVKLDDLNDQMVIGNTSHHPRWAIAYKFKAKQGHSKIKSVEYQVGKIGSITPVAKIDPIPLAGVTVQSISLHNEDFITSKDLMLGDVVVVERAGDVIPYIVKSIPDLRSGDEQPINFPRHCPFSEEEVIALVRDEGESIWRCPKCVCGQQDLQKLMFFVSKTAMNIDGFGRSNVQRFFELGLLRSFADIYRLDFEKIRQLDGFGSKSVEKLGRAIELSKHNSIDRLLQGLSIHHLGARAAQILSKEISHVMDLREMTEEQLTAIKDIGPVLARNVIIWFSNPDNVRVLEELERLGVNLKAGDQEEVVIEGPLTGQSILFTGSLSLTRSKAEQLAKGAGASIASGVSKNLNILVVGDKAGSKLKKAQKIPSIQILNEQEFIDILG